jgi:hypothetical protein
MLTPHGFLKRKVGFCRTDFVGADGGRSEPLNHLTLKIQKSDDFREAFELVVNYAETHEAMAGYIEGEVITMDNMILWKPFNPSIPVPFTLQLTSLPSGSFRESEIHLTLCPERSDPRLLQRLKDMGLLMIYMPKPSGIALVCTAQGKRDVITCLAEKLSAFLEAAGGAVGCSIKEERVAKWWISHSSVQLPLVVDTVIWIN